MKHDIKVTLILLAMFFVTQLIGLVVINAYAPKVIQVPEKTPEGIIIVNKTIMKEIPYGMQPPEMKPQVSIASIITAILLATLLFFILTKIRAGFMLKAWFFFVVLVTIAIALTALLSLLFPSLDIVITPATKTTFPLTYCSIIALAIALILTFYKIVRRNLIVHNLSELLIYPGLAAVFVPILNIFWVIVLLLIISVYDMWAVWKSKFMIKLAKYQIQKLKLFTGFFLPYISAKALNELKKLKKLKKLKQKTKAKTAKIDKAKLKRKKIRISLAILGGGDVAFPLIFAGVVLRTTHSTHPFISALIVSIAVTLSLLFLFVFAKKERFYPAMPFLTIGCIIGYLISLLI